MLFSFPAPFWDCPLFSFFPSFFPLFFPKRGSPLMPREASGYQFPSLRLCPSAPPHLFTFLCPYLEISRSPPLVWSANTLTSSAVEKAGPTHWDSVDLTLTIVWWLKAMSVRVRFRSLQSSSGCALARTLVPTHLAAAVKVTDFFFFLKQISYCACGGRNGTPVTGQRWLF